MSNEMMVLLLLDHVCCSRQKSVLSLKTVIKLLSVPFGILEHNNAFNQSLFFSFCDRHMSPEQRSSSSLAASDRQPAIGQRRQLLFRSNDHEFASHWQARRSDTRRTSQRATQALLIRLLYSFPADDRRRQACMAA